MRSWLGSARFLLLRDQGIETLWRQAPIQAPIDHYRRRAGAVPQTEHGLQRKGTVGGRFMKVHAETTFGVLRQVFPAHGLARLGTAHTHRMPSGRCLAEEV